MSAYKILLRPLLFWFGPERAHQWSLIVVPLIAPFLKLFGREHRNLKIEIAGLTFDSPVGLAAGFDKDLECFQHMYSFGFGSIEVGTITPREQAGNDGKRIQRLVKHDAIVNRMGFPSVGLDLALVRLRSASRLAGPIGVNIGANKDSEDRVQDYLMGYRAVAEFADYVTVNVSSPNTPGLRELESGDGLQSLVDALDREIAVAKTPVFLKVSPDLSDAQINQTCDIVSSSKISALIVGNTTTSRPTEIVSFYKEIDEGGLSGAPLKAISLAALRRFSLRLNGQVPLISVGGVSSAADVLERIEAGASLVQLYTGLIYEGPMLVHKINNQLASFLEKRGGASLQDVIGAGMAPRSNVTVLMAKPMRMADAALVA